MRQDFYLHIVFSLLIFYFYRKLSWLIMIQIGKETFDFISYGGFDLLDWWSDFLAILIILITKRL